MRTTSSKAGNAGAGYAGVVGRNTREREAAACRLHRPFGQTIKEERIGAFSQGLRRRFLFWAVGADMTGDAVEKIDFSFSTVLVIGSEGKGISRLLKEKLDYAVQIPMMGEINSLNASVAAAILMYEVMKRRKLNG